MINSHFTNLGSDTIMTGGAMYLLNTDASISLSEFTMNSAIEGGAISYDCATTTVCAVSISNCIFSHNSVTEKGGAINYELFRPTLEDNTFLNNSAAYGNDIASYAIKIKILDSESDEIIFDNVGSGITFETSFTLALYDHDGQISLLDSVSQIKINGNSTGSYTSGINAVLVTNGQAVFSGLVLYSDPGDQNVMFDVESSAVDLARLKIVYGLDYALEKLISDFRYCKPGESIEGDNSCSE
jgi:hypothetical protein